MRKMAGGLCSLQAGYTATMADEEGDALATVYDEIF